MSRFRATTESVAIVAADRMRIWAALTDPAVLPTLVPLVQRIDADGDVWTWRMGRVSALGVSIEPLFTEQMTFLEGRRIDYRHAPPAGTHERSGVQGCYELSDVDGGTRLAISLTLEIEVPLPRALAPAVTRVMRTTMHRTGGRFADNLLAHLGVDVPGRTLPRSA